MKSVLLALISLSLSAGAVSAEPPVPVRAHHVITVADDFVVEAYHNGRAIPLSRRELVLERFGATAERMDVEVRAGDWLVFNVVNNRLRWNGCAYFAVAGCLERDGFGFVSDLNTHDWCVCDAPGEADLFITSPGFLSHRPAQAIGVPWAEGEGWMRRFAGDSWTGTPLWGTSRNTWIKVNVR